MNSNKLLSIATSLQCIQKSLSISCLSSVAYDLLLYTSGISLPLDWIQIQTSCWESIVKTKIYLCLSFVLIGIHNRFDDDSQIYKRDPRPCIPPRDMASSAMGLKLGDFDFFGLKMWVLSFADHTLKKQMQN